VLPAFSSWRLVLQDTQLPMQPMIMTVESSFPHSSIFLCSISLSIATHSGIDPYLFAADLRFQFARSIMTKIIHF
jgi:hypothetical protein